MACCLIVCFVKGPHEPGWFGWTGGWQLRDSHGKAVTEAPSAVSDKRASTEEREAS